MVQVQVIPSVKCPECGGTNVMKSGKRISCEDCRSHIDTRTGVVTKMDRNWHEKKGFIRKEPDDYGPRY